MTNAWLPHLGVRFVIYWIYAATEGFHHQVTKTPRKQIEGVGKSPKKFFLAHVFIVDKIEPSKNPPFRWIAYGTAGRKFQRQEKLNDFDWFLDLKKRLRFGLQQITKDKYISELLRRAESEGHTLDAS